MGGQLTQFSTTNIAEGRNAHYKLLVPSKTSVEWVISTFDSIHIGKKASERNAYIRAIENFLLDGTSFVDGTFTIFKTPLYFVGIVTEKENKLYCSVSDCKKSSSYDTALCSHSIFFIIIIIIIIIKINII
uniref:SWIM-type domain-containing protein n=1 Tax=Heterorhabditis bacteriophora TaxID=37862 RepID=A0A1I7XH96_HETBA